MHCYHAALRCRKSMFVADQLSGVALLFGATFGLRLSLSEMIPPQGFEDLLQNLIADMQRRPASSVLLECNLGRNFPSVPAAPVSAAQAVPHHTANAIAQAPNFFQIPHS